MYVVILEPDILSKPELVHLHFYGNHTLQSRESMLKGQTELNWTEHALQRICH